MAINVTKNNFQSEVKDFKGLVLVDFWAAWCGPCQMLGPLLESLEKEYSEKFKLVKIDVDSEQELAQAYQITSIPSVYVFNNGIQKDVIIGYNQKETYKNALGL